MDQESASKKILEESQGRKKQSLRYHNIQVSISQGVFSPKHFNGWKIFTDHFPNFNDKKILEIGTGTGITSLFLAKNGAKEVIATDISNDAVKNCTENIVLNKLKNITTFQSDIFSNIQEKHFDIIYWNLPFIWKVKSYIYTSMLERGLFDPGYELLERFLKEAPLHLKKNGTVVVGFADFGNEKAFKKIIIKNNYTYRLLAHEASTEVNNIYFSLYELTHIKNLQDKRKIFYSMPFSIKKYEEIITERKNLDVVAKRYNLLLLEQFIGIEKEKQFCTHNFDPQFIVKKDQELIQQADVVIADYSNHSIGRDFEVGFAKNMCNKKIISIVSEAERHPWIRYYSNFLVKDTNEAFTLAKKITLKP